MGWGSNKKQDTNAWLCNAGDAPDQKQNMSIFYHTGQPLFLIYLYLRKHF